MAETTGISWTDATWNPATGCSKVSDGCTHCYAETLSLRMGWSAKPWAAAYAKENVVLHPDRLELPLKWRKPRMVFVNSMSDLFHEVIPEDFIHDVFTVMEMTPQHTYQVLTKRPARMAEMMNQWVAHKAQGGNGIPVPLPNVWLGTSVEAQREANLRIPHLLETPAAVRFLSCEPLLGPLDISAYLHPDYHLIDWVIVGGESGAHMSKPEHADRWMKPEWARDLRDQCEEGECAFFMKQHSAVRSGVDPFIVEADGSHTQWHQFPTAVVEVSS